MSVEKCNQTISSSLFKKGPNGDLVINSNTTIKAGSVINEPKVTYLP
ncbi:hypothetical protein HC766_02655 [Candidatus Gracilibacteria bacterium]|nr:hypothetical protein [Candidatus Gracilibacteria bacterium]